MESIGNAFIRALWLGDVLLFDLFYVLNWRLGLRSWCVSAWAFWKKGV